MKQRGDRIVMLTAYDARWRGYSIEPGSTCCSSVIPRKCDHGLDTTIPVTLDVMIHHTRAVARGCKPRAGGGRYAVSHVSGSAEQATRNATRLFQEGGAAAVKLEGGRAVADTVRKLTAAGLPVMGHLGLTSAARASPGGMRQQARSESAAQN